MGSDDRSTLATTKNSTCASISTIDCNQRDALEYLADLVLEHLPAPVVVLDAEERVIWSNAAARLLFDGCPRSTPLAELDPSAAAVPLPGGACKLARFSGDSAARLAQVARAGAEAGSLAHEIKNARSSVSLALRAVARALDEDEQSVLADLVARLQGVERRIRDALGSG